MKLNNEQKRAVDHINGPLLVIAGPGSGKTSAMTERLYNMIYSHKIPQSKILVLTFSRAAASEMKHKFLNKTQSNETLVLFGTFHSIFLKMLKEFYGNSFNYNLIDSNIQFEIISLILNKFGYKISVNSFVEEILRDISLFKNSDININSYKPVSCGAKIFKDIFFSYKKELNKLNLIDFDDILIFMLYYLRNDKKFSIHCQSKFDYILIDEFQDINYIQFESIKIISKNHNNVFAVGDEDQSIYAFRGSKPDIMLNFKKSYPEADIIYLYKNYRSGQLIVESANKLIKHNRLRYNKIIHSAIDLISQIKIKSYKNNKSQLDSLQILIKSNENESIAILCRTNMHKKYYSKHLTQKNLKILTMHESKGLEFDTVIIPDLSEDICPYKHKFYKRNIEEERRLFYVAVTRAKKNLYLSYCKYEKKRKLKKSRFIREM